MGGNEQNVAQKAKENCLVVNGDNNFGKTNWDHLASNDLIVKMLLQKFKQLSLVALLKTNSSIDIWRCKSLSICFEISEEENFSDHKFLLAEKCH